MKKIIMSRFPGLGDAMQFSMLPRRFTELGDEVYISSRSPYRNPEIPRLVWETNPYVKGYTDEEPNAGDGGGAILQHKTGQLLWNWEAAHGLTPQTKYPELYYEPKLIKAVEGKVLVDITSTSGKDMYEPDPIRDYLAAHTKKENVEVCLFSTGISIPMLLVDGYSMLFVEDIFHYCDLIYSAKKFITLHSGGMVLASALQKHKPIDCDCLMTRHPVHLYGLTTKHHCYDNINYITIC